MAGRFLPDDAREQHRLYLLGLQQNDTVWPYKKMDGSSFVGITPPENWANIVYFSEAPRATYKEIREARPAQAMSRKAMMDFIEACKLKNCVVQEGYIRSLGMK